MARLIDTELAGLPSEFAAALATELRTKLDNAPRCILRFDTRVLARRWGVKAKIVEIAICEAGRLAGLAVGIIGDGNIDVMTNGTATLLWAADADIGQIARHDGPWPPSAPMGRVN